MVGLYIERYRVLYFFHGLIDAVAAGGKPRLVLADRLVGALKLISLSQPATATMDDDGISSSA
jgi:hypothetical protein